VDPNLKTFTVFEWTSTSQNITNPYNDLVFPSDPPMTRYLVKAPRPFGAQSQGTLKGDDLARFLKHLDDRIDHVVANETRLSLVIPAATGPATWANAQSGENQVVLGGLYRQLIEIKLAIGFPGRGR
jgi:hypothetical protein